MTRPSFDDGAKEHEMRIRPMRRLAMGYARLRYGKTPEPLTLWADHGGVFWTWSAMESMVEASWRALPQPLRNLAVLKAASTMDCPWCLDFGSHLARKGGLSEQKLRDVHRWRESDVYDELERLVLEYAEQVTSTPIGVDDAVVTALRERLGDKALVELTAYVALENLRSRFNRPMGVLPQGWSRVCALPTPARAG